MTVVEQIREAAERLGFARMGICSAERFERGANALHAWLEAGQHGEMGYMAEHPGRAEPRSLHPTAKSVLVVALAYGRPQSETPALHGRVAAYAAGRDYHLVFREKLTALAEAIEAITGGAVLARACVDSAPLLEREAAERAGVGFIAKSTMAIAPGLGSFVLLGELLLDLELPVSTPARTRCGSCTRCLDACPTAAFSDPFVLDARRCISYLTIEYRGVIARELRPLLGNWIFGCDVCQTVCPFNASKKPRPVAPELEGNRSTLNLCALLRIGSAAHRRLVADTPLRRAPRWQLMRNAAVALGNSDDPSAIPDLIEALRDNRYPLVRGHVAWALGRLNAHKALEVALTEESDDYVRGEIRDALGQLAS